MSALAQALREELAVSGNRAQACLRVGVSPSMANKLLGRRDAGQPGVKAVYVPLIEGLLAYLAERALLTASGPNCGEWEETVEAAYRYMASRDAIPGGSFQQVRNYSRTPKAEQRRHAERYLALIGRQSPLGPAHAYLLHIGVTYSTMRSWVARHFGVRAASRRRKQFPSVTQRVLEELRRKEGQTWYELQAEMDIPGGAVRSAVCRASTEPKH